MVFMTWILMKFLKKLKSLDTNYLDTLSVTKTDLIAKESYYNQTIRWENRRSSLENKALSLRGI